MGCCSSGKETAEHEVCSMSAPMQQRPAEPFNTSQAEDCNVQLVNYVKSYFWSDTGTEQTECSPCQTVASYAYHRPPLWYFTCTEQVIVVDLQPTDPEYISVAERFHQTTPNQIARIQVVQNKSLYKKFAEKHDEISKALGRSATIMRLFHGAYYNDPKVIYESPFGLDSSLGGTRVNVGTFYALNSCYSASYAHVAADGTYEMFLCEVITRDSQPQQYIWITYEPMMNYPHFLINYR